MNCQDIERVLDDGDVERLDEVQRREVEAHLAGCPGCALEVEICRRLADGIVPAPSPGLVARCQARVEAQPAAGATRRASGKAIVLGTMLVVAAAAATLVVREVSVRDRQGEIAEVLQTPALPAATLPPASLTAIPGEAADAVPFGAVSAPPADAQPAQGLQRVRLQPLNPVDMDATSVLLLEQLHHALTHRLAAMPGVELQDYSDPDGTDHALISLRLAGTRPDGLRAIGLTAIRMRAGQAQGGVNMNEGLMPGESVEAKADWLTELLRRGVLDSEASAADQLHARMQDPLADAATRLDALQQLLSPAPASMDPARHKAVLDLAIKQAASDPDPFVRDESWGLLQSRYAPALTEAAVEALELYYDEDVRLRLVGIIANGMRGQSDPRALAVLESVAADEARLITRMVAARAVSGDKEWTNYVDVTLRDTLLSDAARLEPFSFAFHGVSTLAATTGAATTLATTAQPPVQLGADAIRVASELVTRVAREPAHARQAIIGILALATTPGDEARDALLGILRSGGVAADSPVRAAVLVPLMVRRGDDPVVRELVGQLATSDPDPLMRRRAAQVLQVTDELQKQGRPLMQLPGSALVERPPLVQ